MSYIFKDTHRTFDRYYANYDLLRAICCITVVILHVSSMYVNKDFQEYICKQDYIIATFYRVISNLAVPSFVMMSGAFLIKDQNGELCFYKKMLIKIVIPTLVFSGLYVLMHYAEIFLANCMGVGAPRYAYTKPLRDFFIGKPHATMWFMYMIIGLYCVTPFIIWIKNQLNYRSYCILGMVLMIHGIIVTHYCQLIWTIWWIQYIGYFMLGNIIFESLKNVNLGKMKKYIFILLIIIAYGIQIVYWYMKSYVAKDLVIPNTFSVPVIVGAIIQFTAFSILGKNIGESHIVRVVAKNSLYIYLIHPFFIEIISQFCGRIIKHFLNANLILIVALTITTICILISEFVYRCCSVLRRVRKCDCR